MSTRICLTEEVPTSPGRSGGTGRRDNPGQTHSLVSSSLRTTTTTVVLSFTRQKTKKGLLDGKISPGVIKGSNLKKIFLKIGVVPLSL